MRTPAWARTRSVARGADLVLCDAGTYTMRLASSRRLLYFAFSTTPTIVYGALAVSPTWVRNCRPSTDDVPK